MQRPVTPPARALKSVSSRGPRNRVDPLRPYAHFVEPERTAEGTIEDIATIFLTNKECPYRCLMCDLWKNTTANRTPAGAIPRQIEWALRQLPPARHLKLYNAGNFFDRQAIPAKDLPHIAGLAAPFKTVIIECHPNMIGPACIDFAESLRSPAETPNHPGANRHYIEPPPEPQASACAKAQSQEDRTAIVDDAPLKKDPPASPLGKGGKRGVPNERRKGPALEVAMGLETVDPQVLPRLNKRMTLKDYERATKFLIDHGIAVRAFILLRTPFQTEQEGLDWAKRSMDYAFSIGVRCCALIPTRTGNGAMEWLRQNGRFTPPSPVSIETAIKYGLSLGAGRVFVDLWDIEEFFPCTHCRSARIERLRHMNLDQETPAAIECACGT